MALLSVDLLLLITLILKIKIGIACCFWHWLEFFNSPPTSTREWCPVNNIKQYKMYTELRNQKPETWGLGKDLGATFKQIVEQIIANVEQFQWDVEHFCWNFWGLLGWLVPLASFWTKKTHHFWFSAKFESAWRKTYFFRWKFFITLLILSL